MKLGQVLVICSALTAVALGVFSYKALALKFPVLPNEEANSWLLESKIRFAPQYKEPLKVHFYKAHETASLSLVDENIVANDYGITETVGEKTGNRGVTLTKREARMNQAVFYQALFYEIQSSDQRSRRVSMPEIPALPRRASQEPVLSALNALAAEAREKSADPVTLALEAVKLLKNDTDDRVMVLKNNLPDSKTLSQKLVLLLNADKTPARVVNGVELKENKRTAPFMQWVEVYGDGKWNAVDVENEKGEIPSRWVPIWRGSRPFAEVEGGNHVSVDISVKYNRESAVTLARWKSQKAARWVSNWSLFSLPVETQIMFGIILMIPLGGLVIAFLRQVIGLPTYGTFMPVLVALSFRETGLFFGIILFASIVAIGLFLRAYFDKLRLLVVPRLASVLTIVVLLIALLTLVTYRLGINIGLSITLFPMIILTMMIERMALMTEEFGAGEARKSAYGSLTAAILAYFAMHNTIVTHLVFVFPELLLIVLAVTILLGRYNGYKLSEYFRFKKLARAIAEAEEK
jgi:hypothetical protein